MIMDRSILSESELSELDLGRQSVASGGWLSRNNVEAYFRGLISLSELLKRTVSGSQAKTLDEA